MYRVRPVHKQAWRVQAFKYTAPFFALILVGMLGFAVVQKVFAESWPATKLHEHELVVVPTASAFLTLILKEDTAGAYRSLCESTRDRYTEDEFAAYVRAHALRGFAPSKASPAGYDIAYFVLTYRNGTTEVHGITVYQRHVCGRPY